VWLLLWLGLLLGTAFSFLPDLEIKQKAAKRRRDFRHAIGSFLDLFAMNLAGGRGVPEALMTASDVGRGRRACGAGN
jgi:Flp pilus assembly protein TadB